MAKNRPSRREFALWVTSALGASTVAAHAEPRYWERIRRLSEREDAAVRDIIRRRPGPDDGIVSPPPSTPPSTPPNVPPPVTAPPATGPTGLAFRSQVLAGNWQGARWPMADDICQKAFGTSQTPSPHLRLGQGFGVKQGVARQDARKAFSSLWNAGSKRLMFRAGTRVPAVLSNYDLPGGVIWVDASYDGPPITFDNWRIDTVGTTGFGYNKHPGSQVAMKLSRCEIFNSNPNVQRAAGLVRLGTNDRLETSYIHHSGSDFVKFGDGTSNMQIVQNLMRYGGLGPGKPHFDAIQITGSVSNLLVDQNVLYAPAASSPYYEGGVGIVSALRCVPQSGSAVAANITMTRNLCLGWGQVFSIETGNSGSVHSAVYDGNVVGDVGTWAQYMLLSQTLRTRYNPSIHNVLFTNNRLLDGTDPVFMVRGKPASTLNGLYNLDRRDSLAAALLQRARTAGFLNASNQPLTGAAIYWTMR
ncbi:MAG: hypothetical protein H6923_04020 [Alphaproteobacteria bacterium]|nr:hypothetical protein [Alphaproteobacteria bacterium]